jgi:ADP-ribosylglycohydrolase
MLGGIAGDIIGSRFEHKPVKTTEFSLFSMDSTFTDDTVLTIAVAECLLGGGDYAAAYRAAFQEHPRAGWGGMFTRWAKSGSLNAYGSYGNGSAMRVGPIGYAFESLEATLREAERSAAVTHDHPEGIKGAQAVAAAIWLARNGETQAAIRRLLEARFGYDLSRRLDEIRPVAAFDESCQGSVPQAIIAFLEATDFESAIRNAVSLGADADTQACIAGSIAEAYFKGVPDSIRGPALIRLPEKMGETVTRFQARYGVLV